MTFQEALIVTVLIVAIWIVFLFSLAHLHRINKDLPKAPKVLSIKTRKSVSHKLCEFHLTRRPKANSLIVVDGRNCEQCNLEADRKKKGNKDV